MKLPDLSDASGAGLQRWAGSPEVVHAAAVAAHLKYFAADLHGVASKAALLDSLAAALKLPAHFGKNWDALADCLEDEDWLGAHGAAIVLRHTDSYRKAHAADWETASGILAEAAEYWQERHKPFWVFVG